MVAQDLFAKSKAACNLLKNTPYIYPEAAVLHCSKGE
jgi:hypothetical protein